MERNAKIVWRRDLRPNQALFSIGFQRTIREDFKLSRDGIDFLSSRLTQLLVYGRPPYLSVLPVIFEPKEGRRVIAEALQELSNARVCVESAKKQISELKFLGKNYHPDAEMDKFIENRFNEASKHIDLLKTSLLLCARSDVWSPILPEAIGQKKRSNGLSTHEKRQLFVEACLECRRLEGKHIGYTSSDGKRGGETIRFIQAVFRELTELNSTLPSSTIRGDIRLWGRGGRRSAGKNLKIP
jgi:hypothetical protein